MKTFIFLRCILDYTDGINHIIFAGYAAFYAGAIKLDEVELFEVNVTVRQPV